MPFPTSLLYLGSTFISMGVHAALTLERSRSGMGYRAASCLTTRKFLLWVYLMLWCVAITQQNKPGNSFVMPVHPPTKVSHNSLGQLPTKPGLLGAIF